MDIISLGKATKAKKAIKETQNRIGMNGTEQDLDIRDKYENADERLTAIEERDPQVELYNRVGEVAEHTSINLNKYNLKVGSLLNQSRYRFSDMVIDDFTDSTGIDFDHSTNIEYDSEKKVVKALNKEEYAVLITVSESFDKLNSFILSSLFSMNTFVQEDIDLSQGSFEKVVYKQDEGVKLEKEDHYAYEGVYETSSIYLGESILEINYPLIEAVVPDGTEVRLQFAYSNDGEVFTDYTENLLKGNAYVKIKLILKAKIDRISQELILNQEDENTTYSREQFELKVIGEKDNMLIRNIQKYTPLEYSEEEVDVSYTNLYRLNRIVDKGWNR